MARPQIILLLAKDGLSRKVTAAGLQMYGYEVLTADDGEQALEMLGTRRQITLLVTDADLSGPIDGMATARLARNINPNLDIIYTSRMPHRIQPGAKVRGAPTLRDPYHPHQLVGVLSHLRYRSAEIDETSAA